MLTPVYKASVYILVWTSFSFNFRHFSSVAVAAFIVPPSLNGSFINNMEMMR